MVFRALQQPQVQPQQAPAQQTPSGFRPLQQPQANQQQLQAGQDQRIDQLFEQLGGEVPLTREQQGTRFQPTVKTLAQTGGDVQQRQQAFNELLQKGFTREQIELSLQTKKALGRPRIGRPAGGIGGALAATAIAGRFIPGPIDDAAIIAALIASGGAGLGGVAGEAIQTGLEERRLIGKREALKAFTTEAGTELAGRGLVGATKFALSPFIKRTVPEAAALIDDFAKVGGTFSPTELDRRFTLRVGEAFSRGGFGAQQIFQEFEEKQGRAVLAFADNIIESIGEGVARQAPEQIGEIFAQGITRPDGRVFNLLDELFDPLFKQIDEVAKGSTFGFRQIRKGGPAIRGVSGRFQPARELQRISITPTVSTKSLKQFALKNLATDKRLNGQFLSPIGRSKLQKIVGTKEFLTFSDMRTLRSSFLRDTRKLARDVDQSQGLIKQLAGITDNAIFDPKAAKGLNPEALNLLRNTNSLYKASQKGLETTFSESLAKRLLKNPSTVVKELFPNNNPKAIRISRKSLVEPISGKPSEEGKALWNQLRQTWLADAVDQATKEGVANPRLYNNILRKLGREGFEEMFPEKSVRASVDKVQDLFNIAGRRPPAGLSLFSRGAQTVGVVKLWQGAAAGDVVGITSGGLLSIGPLAFAKLATNPKGIKFLTSGLKLKPGASGLVPNAVRMINLLKDMNQKEIRQRNKKVLTRRKKRFAESVPPLTQLRGFGGRGF